MLQRLAPIVIAFVSLLVWVPLACAHFNLNLNVRILHVEHVDDGLRVYLRTPMPYLVADRVGSLGTDGLPAPAPYTTNRFEDEGVVHLVDQAALRADPWGLARIVAEGLDVEVDGTRLPAEAVQIRVHPISEAPGFATLEEARAAFEREPSPIADTSETYVGDALVDVVLEVASIEPVAAYSLASNLDPSLTGQEDTANLILDHAEGQTQIYRARGLLTEPVLIARSSTAAAYTFVVEGVHHILEGPDHLLFVICLVLGATGLPSLLARITGFTIGHSVTLSAGFFGYVPSGGWFVPTVEIGIALSIIYAAAIALAPKSQRRGGELAMFVITCAIGLLHGLGFSFVLHEILQVDAPNVWQSLLAFNVGVELGQLLIVAIALPVFITLRHLGDHVWRIARIGTATCCIVIASVWTGERTLMLVGTA